MTTSEHESPAVSDLTPREAAARRLLVLRALKTLVDAEEKKARAAAEAVYNRVGQKDPAELPDGTPLGNVRTDKGTAGGWKVTDEPAFRTWVERYLPDAIVVEVVETKKVDPVYQALVLGAQTPEGWLDEATGEEHDWCPPGVSYVKAGPPKLVVTGDKGAADAVRQWLAPALAQLEADA